MAPVDASQQTPWLGEQGVRGYAQSLLESVDDLDAGALGLFRETYDANL